MVGLTFFSERDNSTLQISALAQVVEDQKLADYILDSMQKKHAMQGAWAAPVTKVDAGSMVVIGLSIKLARLTEYQSDQLDYLGSPSVTEYTPAS
jgi:hypothetical protein